MTRINCLIIKFSCKPENVVKSVNAKSFTRFAVNISENGNLVAVIAEIQTNHFGVT